MTQKAHTYVEPEVEGRQEDRRLSSGVATSCWRTRCARHGARVLASGVGLITLHGLERPGDGLRTMIAAGVNVKALSTFMGHSSITITLDRYGHLLPGSEEEAAGMRDAYLGRSAGQKWASEGQ